MSHLFVVYDIFVLYLFVLLTSSRINIINIRIKLVQIIIQTIFRHKHVH